MQQNQPTKPNKNKIIQPLHKTRKLYFEEKGYIKDREKFYLQEMMRFSRAILSRYQFHLSRLKNQDYLPQSTLHKKREFIFSGNIGEMSSEDLVNLFRADGRSLQILFIKSQRDGILLKPWLTELTEKALKILNEINTRHKDMDSLDSQSKSFPPLSIHIREKESQKYPVLSIERDDCQHLYQDKESSLLEEQDDYEDIEDMEGLEDIGEEELEAEKHFYTKIKVSKRLNGIYSAFLLR